MYRVYFPWLPVTRDEDEIEAQAYPCGMAAETWLLWELIRTHPDQRRKRLDCDPRLVAAAYHKAKIVWEDTPQRGHTFRGKTANQNVEDFGYRLPAHYTDNQVESWISRDSPEHAFEDLLASPPHRAHLLAEHDFYADQVVSAVGYYRSDGTAGMRPHVFVVLLCPPD